MPRSRTHRIGPLSPAYRSITVGMVALVVLSAFESLAVTTAMPTVSSALGGAPWYALAFAGPLATGVIGMVAGGLWSDRSGPVEPLLVGTALFAASLLIAGLAPTMGILVAGRILQGCGSGMLTVALYVVVGRAYPVDIQPQVFTAFAAGWVVPSMVGPAVSGLIVDHMGWRWVFLLVPIVAVPALIAVRPAFVKLRGPAPTESSPPGPATAEHATPERANPQRTVRTPAIRPTSSTARLTRATVAAAGAIILYLGGQRGAEAGSEGDLLIGGAMILTGLVLIAIGLPSLLPAGTLRFRRGLPTVIGLRGLVGAGFTGTEVYLPLLFTAHGLSATEAGLALTAGGLGWFTGSWVRGRPSRSMADHTVVVLGSALAVLGITCVIATALGWLPLWLGIAIWAVAGFGMGLTYPTLSVLTLRLSAPNEQGANTSALQVFESLATTVVLAIGAMAFTWLGGETATASYVACFGLSFVLICAAALLARRVGSTAVELQADGPSLLP